MSTGIFSKAFRHGKFARCYGARKTAKKTTLEFSDLPSIAVPKKVTAPESSINGRMSIDNCPPALKEVRKLMDNYPGKVVLTELGKFYELYFEHADVYAPQLNLKVAKKLYSNGKVSMAGFPTPSCLKYVDLLVNELGVDVVLVKQYLQPTDDNVKRFDRRVHRIITPGTIIEKDILKIDRNNFLLAVSLPKSAVTISKDVTIGVAWCDISTMEFYVQESRLASLRNDLFRIKPTEIIIPAAFRKVLEQSLLLEDFKINWIDTELENPDYESILGKKSVKELGQFLETEQSASHLLLDYIQQHFKLEGDSLFRFRLKRQMKNIMMIDSAAREALEITETMKTKSKKNTVYSTIRRTCTVAGSRTLGNWLDSPPYDIKESRARLNLVKRFVRPGFYEDGLARIVLHLKQQSGLDCMRLMFEIGFNNTIGSNENVNVGLAMNYVNLLKILESYASIRQILEDNQFDIAQKITIPHEVVETVDRLINQENLRSLNETLEEQEAEASKKNFPDMTWIIDKSASTALTRHHNTLDKLLKEMQVLEHKLKDISTEILVKAVQLRIENDVPLIYVQFGSKLLMSELHERFEITGIHKQSKTSCHFINHEWQSLALRIVGTIRNIKAQEMKVLNQLRKLAMQHFEVIKSTSETIDYIDVLQSFARLAKDYNLVCPVLNEKASLNIVNGRHLVVEQSLQNNGVEFQGNDCCLDRAGKFGSIISGPNMGGKSTYLRQNALIVILAQIGSFVPAKKATIGLVDKIFTRIGSADDITNHSSTFMVEMSETCNGLVNATSKSLIIFDEIGRGTSNKEGIAIAFGILSYLTGHLQARFLFATHYAPELNALVVATAPDMNDKLLYYHTTLKHEYLNKYLETYDILKLTGPIFNGRFFDHTLVPGISEYSHAISIAKLAGIPGSVTESAQLAISFMNRQGAARAF